MEFCFILMIMISFQCLRFHMIPAGSLFLFRAFGEHHGAPEEVMQISGSTLESMAEQWAETAGRRPAGPIGKGVGLGWLGWLGYIEVNLYMSLHVYTVYIRLLC